MTHSLHRIWLLVLVPETSIGRWLGSIIIFLTLYRFFTLGDSDTGAASAAALFFSVIIAYMVPVFSYITEKTMLAFDELRPIVNLDADQYQRLRESLHRKSLKWILTSVVAGMLFALLHTSVMAGSPWLVIDYLQRGTGAFTGFMGTVLVWSVMTTAIHALIDTALTFRRLGTNHVVIDLLQVHRLVPFARVAIISSLALIGALAFFPLLMLDRSFYLIDMLLPIAATATPMVILFIIVIWPVHRRLVQVKIRTLAGVNSEISVHRIQATDQSQEALDDRLIALVSQPFNYET